MKKMCMKYLLLIPVLACLSCGGGGDDPQPPVETKNPPSKAVGTLPANGEPCSDYELIEGNVTEVSVSFSWNSAQFATQYRLDVIRNGTAVYSTTGTARTAQVTLSRGTTYTWSVTALNDDGQTPGDSYSFTTPGTPESNFAPYPAAITLTFDASAGTLLVSWTGNDQDGDPLVFDALVYEDGSLIAEAENLATPGLGPLSYRPDSEYTVEVTSRDSFGNETGSAVTETAPE